MATWNSRGLRGSTLEDLINRTNEQYAEIQRSTAHRLYKIAVCPESRHFRFKIGKFMS